MTVTKEETAPAENDYSGHTFLVMWCSEGLECVIDITSIERKQIWASLSGKVPESMPSLNALIMRAKFNAQRFYEIYLVTAVDGITDNDIKEMFESNPQYGADLIRERGKALYVEPKSGRKQVIV